MNIKLLTTIIAILVLNTGITIADSQRDSADLETYIWLEREGIFDADVSTEKVHDLLSQGLEHENPEIVHCSISAIVLYIGVTGESRVNGVPTDVNRQLQELPGLYDQLIELWENGYEASKGIFPPGSYPDDYFDRVVSKTGCLAPDPIWTSLALPLAYLFPGDEKVYDIIWKELPHTKNPGSLLMGLFDGKFDNPKDQRFRINLLLNRETELYNSRLAARSLGDFRSEEGLVTLATVLQEEKMKYGTPTVPIVEAMLKYGEEAVEYVPLMREKLKSAVPFGKQDEEMIITLKERMIHFVKEHGEPEQPIP